MIKWNSETGALLATIASDKFVTGARWMDGELWHGTWEGDDSELRRVDARSGEVAVRLAMLVGGGISGLESDGAKLFYAGRGSSGWSARSGACATREPAPRLPRPRLCHRDQGAVTPSNATSVKDALPAFVPASFGV